MKFSAYSRWSNIKGKEKQTIAVYEILCIMFLPTPELLDFDFTFTSDRMEPGSMFWIWLNYHTRIVAPRIMFPWARPWPVLCSQISNYGSCSFVSDPLCPPITSPEGSFDTFCMPWFIAKQGPIVLAEESHKCPGTWTSRQRKLHSPLAVHHHFEPCGQGSPLIPSALANGGSNLTGLHSKSSLF